MGVDADSEAGILLPDALAVISQDLIPLVIISRYDTLVCRFLFNNLSQRPMMLMVFTIRSVVNRTQNAHILFLTPYSHSASTQHNFPSSTRHK